MKKHILSQWKIVAACISLLLIGSGVLWTQSLIQQKYPAAFPGNSLASKISGMFSVQADPPSTCVYENNCKLGAYVYCQEEGGPEYPVVGAQMTDINGVNCVTNSEGACVMNDVISRPGITVQLPPGGVTPNGIPYNQMGPYTRQDINTVVPPSVRAGNCTQYGCNLTWYPFRYKHCSTPYNFPCKTCQYQADLFWGTHIQNFAGAASGGPRYSAPLKRLIAAKALTTPGTPTCPLAPVTPRPTVNPSFFQLPTGCQNPVEKKLLVGTIKTTTENPPTSYVEGTIVNNATQANCIYDVGLAVYKAVFTTPDNIWQDIEKQNLAGMEIAKISPGQKITFRVRTPLTDNLLQCYSVPSPRIVVEQQ